MIPKKSLQASKRNDLQISNDSLIQGRVDNSQDYSMSSLWNQLSPVSPSYPQSTNFAFSSLDCQHSKPYFPDYYNYQVNADQNSNSFSPFPGDTEDAIECKEPAFFRSRNSTMPETSFGVRERSRTFSNPIMDSKGESWKTNYNSTTWSDVAALPPTPSKRPTISKSNRFVSKQLQKSLHGNMKLGNFKDNNAIGIFLWGFPDVVKLQDFVYSFSTFGEILNIGISFLNGIRYAFIDFATQDVQNAFVTIGKKYYFGMNRFLQVRLRYDKNSLPTFTSIKLSPKSSNPDIPEIDRRSIHLQNLPHNINKVEIEKMLSKFGIITKIKIFQRATEKKSSVFVCFKTIDRARAAAEYLKKENSALNSMTLNLVVEYPCQDISRDAPIFLVDPNALPSLSKKSRKLLAASNTICYARSLEPLNENELHAALSAHGPCVVYITKREPPSTAFINFQTSSDCAAALFEKTCGVTLPRHKRVDIALNANEDTLRSFLVNVGEIKSLSISQEECRTTIEFLTAIGAARCIVLFRQQAFQDKMYMADYSPSIKLDLEEDFEDSKVPASPMSIESTPNWAIVSDYHEE